MGQPRDAARYHGDQGAAPGMLDFALNVRSAQPPWPTLLDAIVEVTR